jgi:transcriptional regulator with XRE-family HTH domain
MEMVIEKIKDLRKKKGFSHEYMADKLEISQPAYSKIEKMETVLSVDRLFKIAEILETPVNDILELQPNTVYNQTNNHDNGMIIAHQEVQNLYQDNKEITEKLIQTQQNEIVFLRDLLGKYSGQ